MISFKFQVDHHLPKRLHLAPSWTTSLREVASIESIGKNATKTKLTWMTSMKHLKMVDWQAGRKVQVRRLSHARHGMESLQYELCHGNHRWLKGLAEALKQNKACCQGPGQTFHRAVVSMRNLVWVGFLSEHLQYHVTRPNSRSILSSMVICTLHCRTAGSIL